MRSHETTIRHKLAGAVIVLAFIAAACGSDDGDATPATEAPAATDAPVVTNAPVATEAPADEPATLARVVSLSPTHTEIMFAIGAGDLLVAVDQFSNYPAAALDLPNELSGFEPNVEEIAAFEPDLVLIGGDFSGLGEQLAEIDIPSWDGPAAGEIEDTYAQIEQLGAATGKVGEAAELVSSMQTRIDEIAANAPELDEALTIYHEVDSTYYSADSTSFIGATYSLLGLENIADRAEGENFGFPQLNAEAVVSANPDLIFIPCGTFCTTTPDEVAARPGWDAIAAVQNGNVVEVDEDIASRWGPRVVEYLEIVSEAVATVAVPAS